MSEKIASKPKELPKKLIAGVIASIAIGAGAGEIPSASATKQATTKTEASTTVAPNKLAIQRQRETSTFQRFGRNTRALPGLIDTTLKANYPTTLGFLPGQTARYTLTVGDAHHGSTTLRTVYVKGKLHALTMIENFDDPTSFRKLKETDEYVKMVREKGGWRIEKNQPASTPDAQAMIGSAISTDYIPGYKELPGRGLADRQSAVTELNQINRGLEVFAKDLTQFGLATQP